MNRKDFLSSIVPAAATFNAIAKGQQLKKNDENPIIPAYLKDGDTIGITSPAGYITLEEIQPAVNKLKEWGFKISIGTTIGKKYFTFGGTDEERLADFQQMLDDKKLDAILCARGGYTNGTAFF